MLIRDRVKELRRVSARTLRPSPFNWRTHPAEQKNALRGVLAEIGFAGAELARELADGSLELIDGHCRAEECGDAVIPVLVLDVTEEEAKKLLAIYDPIGDMATANTEALDTLLKEVDSDNQAVQELLDALAHEHLAASEEKKPTSEIPEKYQILIDFKDEATQARYLEKFTQEGLSCRSLIS